MPIIGVIFFDWELFPLILIYWLENAIIGGYTVVKMLTCSGSENIFKKLFLSAFFTFHFGMFWYGHGTFVVGVFGEESYEVSQAYQLVIEYGLQIALIALIISHGFSLVQNFFVGRESKHMTVEKIMFSPYKRVVVLHVFIIFGGMTLQTFGVTRIGLIVLALVKIVADLIAHKMEHKQT